MFQFAQRIDMQIYGIRDPDLFQRQRLMLLDAKMIGAAMRGDDVQIMGKLAFMAVSRDLVDEAQEDLLGDVLGVFFHWHFQAHVLSDRGVIGADERIEGSFIAMTDARDQSFFVHFFPPLTLITDGVQRWTIFSVICVKIIAFMKRAVRKTMILGKEQAKAGIP